MCMHMCLCSKRHVYHVKCSCMYIHVYMYIRVYAYICIIYTCEYTKGGEREKKERGRGMGLGGYRSVGTEEGGTSY